MQYAQSAFPRPNSKRSTTVLLTSRKSDAALLHAIAADDEMTTRLSSEWIALVCSLSYAFGGANYIAETSTSTSGVMYPPWMQSQFAVRRQINKAIIKTSFFFFLFCFCFA